MSRDYIIGIDIGGTNIRIGAVDFAGEIACFQKTRQREVFQGPDAGASLAAYISDFLSANGLFDKAAALSIAFPATLNKDRSVVLQAPNVAGIDGLDKATALEPHFPCPIFFEKDVCAALYYDRVKYSVPPVEILVGCYFGTGMGNIICFNGKPITGKDGAACELGHIGVVGRNDPCGCGNLGCLENCACGKYLDALCRTVFPGADVGRIFVEHAGHPLLDEFVDNMAIAVTTEINILNPDYVIVGGGVTAMEGFPRNMLHERIYAHARKPYPAQSLNIVYAEDDPHKGVVGAAYYARERLGEL